MRRISLTAWIMIAMVTGVIIGLLIHYNWSAEHRKSFSEGCSIFTTDVFLSLIKMLISPLVFSTLVVGIAKLGDVKAMGRIGGKTLLWFMGASLLSLTLGMAIMNTLNLGGSLNLPLPASGTTTGIEGASISLKGFVGHVFPHSIVEAMATNQILQIVVFSILFGVATASSGEKGKIVIKALDAISHIILKMTGYVMYLAPFAALTAIASVIAVNGPDLITTYGKFIISFYLSILGLWLILMLIASIIIGRRVIDLAIAVKDMILLAFSTASSEAAFPKLTEELERFGCPSKIVSFALPLGYSFNLDGSMLYMTFASLFIGQAYGVSMTTGEQISMLLVLMLTSKGIAGVPRAALVVVMATVAQFHIPQEGVILLFGIDQILDMARSATNVLGNSIAAVVVSKWEGELGEAAVHIK